MAQEKNKYKYDIEIKQIKIRTMAEISWWVR